MKIVIDIPDEEYARIMSMDHFKRTYEQDMIYDGTPLYDKVSLKLRGKGYVMYDYDWLKEHIDMEAKIIKGEMI